MSDRLELASVTCLAEFITDFWEDRLSQTHCNIVFVSRAVWHHSELHVSHIGLFLSSLPTLILARPLIFITHRDPCSDIIV